MLGLSLLVAAALAADYGTLPLSFEPNRGQAPAGVAFVSHTTDYSLLIRPDGAAIALASGDVEMRLTGRAKAVTGRQPQAGVASYFTGRDSSKWLRNIPQFGGVQLESVYPGIDLIYYGRGRTIEYDFVVAPGANPRDIRFRLAHGKLLPDGDLVVPLAKGELRHKRPVAYQDIAGVRIPVPVAYKLTQGEISFAVGKYDRRSPLIIDPTIVYATFAGNLFGWYYGIAVDNAGAAYLAGRFTNTTNQTGGFVRKMSPSGNAVIYTIYLGDVEPRGIAVNGVGAAYVTGFARQNNLAVKNAYQGSLRGSVDMFLAKVNPQGSDLDFATYFGGFGDDYGFRIAVDTNGGICLLGWTNSNDLPTRSALRATRQGDDLALVKFNEDASDILFSTYLGTDGAEVRADGGFLPPGESGLALEPNNNIVVSGSGDGNLPLVGPLLTVPSGKFLMRVSPIGAPVQTTWLPAGGGAVAVDGGGNIYVAGKASSLLQGVTPGNGTLSRIAAGSGALSLVSNLGGATIRGVATDVQGNVYVAGSAGANVPTLLPMQAYSAGLDGYVAKWNSGGTMLYATHYGGGDQDDLYGVAADSAGAAYIAGASNSRNLPLVNPISGLIALNVVDGIVAKINDTPNSIGGVTITATPAMSGLEVIVDGVRQTAPVQFNWQAGSTHTISAPALQGSGNFRFRFANWSNNGAATQTITAEAGVTYTATYVTEALVNLGVFPVGAGGVTVTPVSADGYYAEGTLLNVTAVANAGYSFVGWTGSLSGTVAARTYTVVANGQPVTFLANFTATGGVTGGLSFVPTVPCRLIDTRVTDGPRLTGQIARDINVTQGRCGIPTTAKAYSINATVVPIRPLAYLSLYPAGQARPLVSTLNAFEGQIIANAAIVPAGTGGAITAFATDDTELILDINGYFTDSAVADALQFFPLAPCRVLDTRVGAGGPAGAFGPPELFGGLPRSFPILESSCNVPGTAKAYALNLTVVPSRPLDYITAFPTGDSVPFVSTQNSPQGRVLANMALVKAGTNGAISLFAAQTTNALADITGYFAPSTLFNPGLRFYPVTPCRLADTRENSYPAPNGAPILTIQITREIAVGGRCGIPAGTTARAYSLNATVVPAGYLGYLTLFPGPALPFASTLNAWEGQVAANAAIIPASATGTVSVYVSNTTHFILDINGYFAP